MLAVMRERCGPLKDNFEVAAPDDFGSELAGLEAHLPIEDFPPTFVGQGSTSLFVCRGDRAPGVLRLHVPPPKYAAR